MFSWSRAACVSAMLFTATGARALEATFVVEPGIAGPLSAPQNRVFGVGGGAHLAGGLALTRFLDAQLVGGFLGFSAAQGDPATIGELGAGVRFKRPHGSGSFSPWLDGSALYVRTGPLDRFGFAVGAGLAFPVSRARGVWMGAFVRYLQVVQEPERAGFDNTDAKILVGGLSLEVDHAFGRRPPTPASASVVEPDRDRDGDGVVDRLDQCPTTAGPADNGGCPYGDRDGDGVNDRADKCPTVAGPADNGGCPDGDRDSDGVVDREDLCPDEAGSKEAGGCPDRDHDTVADRDDVCPDKAGDPDNHGCPKYLRVTVTENELELSQKVFFSYNGDRVLEKSYALLDEVAQALTDHPSLSVRIEGHTDGRGAPDHNLRLSRRRARAVVAYLVARGIAPERLQAQGYGPTQPLASDDTPEGRERNRRVEFVIIHPPHEEPKP